MMYLDMYQLVNLIDSKLVHIYHIIFDKYTLRLRNVELVLVDILYIGYILGTK